MDKAISIRFKEITDDLAANANAAENADVRTALKQLESLHEEVVEKLSLFGSENAEKRKINNSLERQIRELSGQVETLQTERNEFSQKATEIPEELEGLRKFKNQYVEKRNNEFFTKFESIQSNPRFEKAKELFKLPEEKDGKLDWGSLNETDIEQNINKMNELETIEYFEKKKSVSGKPGSVTQPNLMEQIENATSIEELKQIQAGM